MPDTSTQDMLKSLEDDYVNGKYDHSINNLLQHRDSFDPGLFHYNLGTLHAKKGNYAAGRFHLEKSVKHGFIDPRSFNNLEVVKKELGVRDISNSHATSDKVLDFALQFSGGTYFDVSLLFLFVVVFLSLRNVILTWPSRAIALGLALIPMVFSTLYLSNFDVAMSLKDTPIFEGPSKIFEEKGVIKAGSKIFISERRGNWVLVSYPVHLVGWIDPKGLGVL